MERGGRGMIVNKVKLDKKFNGDMVCPRCGNIYCGKIPKTIVYCGYCYVKDKLIAKEMEKNK